MLLDPALQVYFRSFGLLFELLMLGFKLIELLFMAIKMLTTLLKSVFAVLILLLFMLIALIILNQPILRSFNAFSTDFFNQLNNKEIIILCLLFNSVLLVLQVVYDMGHMLVLLLYKVMLMLLLRASMPLQ